MSKFAFDDTVRIKDNAPNSLRRGQKASVTMVFLPHDRVGSYFDQFPPGVLYSIEYEDGESADAHEDFLETY
jgi:phospholipase C